MSPGLCSDFASELIVRGVDVYHLRPVLLPVELSRDLLPTVVRVAAAPR